MRAPRGTFPLGIEGSKSGGWATVKYGDSAGLCQTADITAANRFWLSIITAQDASSPRASTVFPLFQASISFLFSLLGFCPRVDCRFVSQLDFQVSLSTTNRLRKTAHPPLHRRTLLPDRILKNVPPPHQLCHLPSRRDENHPTLKRTFLFPTAFLYSFPLPSFRSAEA